MSYSIRPLDANAQRAGFDCGEKALDEYLQRYATQDIKRGVARVFVASPAEQPQVVAAIVADAKSHKAVAFYQRFGFIELPGQPGRWMLPRSHFAGLA